MANHASAEKRNRQRIRRTEHNRSIKSAVRGLVKKVRVALAAKDPAAAATALKSAGSAMDKATSKGVVHPKAASRTFSRLASQIAVLRKPA